DEPRLHLLGLRVERLAELHDVQAALAERRPDGRAGIGLAGRNLQLDESDDFLRHYALLVWVQTNASFTAPGVLPGCDDLCLLDLPELQLDRRRAPEDRHRHAQLRLVVVDVLDRAVEVREGPLLDAHRLA